MTDNQQNIDLRLHQYKVKFIKKKLLDGAVLFLGTVLIVYLTLSGIEAAGRFNSIVRAILLFTFILSSGTVFFLRIIKPVIQLFRSEATITDEDAASEIGAYFPKLGDKLLNYIQLSSKTFADNSLAKASLEQRANDMGGYSFTEVISFNNEKRNMLRYILPLVLIIILLIALFPTGFIGSSERIINFNRAYIPQAPFSFELPTKLVAFRNENYTLRVSLTGEALPQEAYFVTNGKKVRLVNAGLGSFELLFPNINSSKTFTIEAASYSSKEYKLSVVDRPSLSHFSVNVHYPPYLRLPDESFQNIGSFEVPEGTTITWDINSKFTDWLTVQFENDSVKVSPENDQSFSFSRQIFKNQPYSLELINGHGHQQGTIVYEVKVIKDEAPEIDVKMLADTLLYSYVVFAGNLSDDHGLSNLRLHYAKNNSTRGIINLPVDRGSTSQSLFYQWVLDTLQVEAGDQLQFYLQVVDNDAINQYKSTRSKLFYLNIPNEEEAFEKLEESKNSTKEQISDASDEAKELKENIDKLVEQLKSKKELSWQEEQILENLIEQKEKLQEQIEKLQQENKMLSEQQKKFESPSSETQEKQEQLQELLDELMDDETRELYEELQKLLESYENTESVQDLLQKIQNKELNLEQELDRALEFFKQIQYEQKLDEASEELDKIIEDQEQLTEQTEEKSQPLDSLAKDQGKLNEDFKDFQEKLSDAEELNQELKRPNSMEDTSGEENDVNKEQNDAKENLEKNNRNKSKQSQKSATEKMKQIAKKMENMRSG